MTSRTRIFSAALAAASLMAVPAVSHADSVTFGSRLDQPPDSTFPRACFGHATGGRGGGGFHGGGGHACTRVATDESFTAPGGLVAPADGTVTRFSIRAGGPGTVTFRLAKLSSLVTIPDFSAAGTGDGTGPTVALQGQSGDVVESFPANLPVHRGDYVGIDSTETSALFCTGTGNRQAVFSPPLSDAGSTPESTSTSNPCELLVQAEMTPATTPATVTTTRAKHRRHHRRHHHRHRHHRHHRRHR